MKGLFVKDMQLLAQQKKMIGCIFLLAVVLNFEMDSSYVITYMTFVSAFLFTSIPAFYEADNGYVFLFTLPVKRKTYIIQKYIFGILGIAIACLTGCLMSLVFYMARGQMDACLKGMLQALMIFPAMLVFVSFMYPVQFKYGTEKSRILLLCLCGIVALIPYLGLRLVESAHIDIRVVGRWIAGHLVWTELVGFAAALLVYVISCLISVRIMNKKEF